jgi:hypothetical protein
MMVPNSKANEFGRLAMECGKRGAGSAVPTAKFAVHAAGLACVRGGTKRPRMQGHLQAHCIRGKMSGIRIDGPGGHTIPHHEPEMNSIPVDPRSNCLSRRTTT